MTTDNRTNEQLAERLRQFAESQRMDGDSYEIARMLEVAAGRLVDEQKVRDSIARDIWNDEQECNLAIRLAKIGSHDHISLLGRLAGLQRARDITQGVLVRDLDEAKLAEVIATASTDWDFHWIEYREGKGENPGPNAEYVTHALVKYLRGES